MCGIFGVTKFTGSIDSRLMVAQRDTLAHRGPDSEGCWISADERVGLAHRRLAIIDLSSSAHQPMVDPETGNVVVFNGEIYNYRELRTRLEGKSHRFRTESDTEVVLVAYREWGEDFVELLEGMFAFGLFDNSTRQLLLARDRAGEKPLYVFRSAEQLQFASESKAILLDPSVPRRVSRQALNEYLAYGYPPASGSIFAGLCQVQPGTVLRIDTTSGATRSRAYWSLPECVGPTNIRPIGPLVDELWGLLAVSTRRQLVADVPVGVLLSGGLDSSLVAVSAAAISSRPLSTFTVRFEGHGSFDEGPYASLVAKAIGSKHTEIRVPRADADLLVDLIGRMDEPLADSSFVATYLVAREIRRHAKVALGGDGGDEVFGGYPRYSHQLRADRFHRRLPPMISHILQSALPRRVLDTRLGRVTDRFLGGADRILASASRLFMPSDRARMSACLRDLRYDELCRPELRRAEAHPGRSNILDRATALDFTNYLPGDVLTKVDRASMLCSLEIRAPLLDRHIIEFGFGRLSPEQRATERARKVLLRELASRQLPTDFDVSRKQGFSVPLEYWFNEAWAPVLDSWTDHESLLVSKGTISRLRKRMASWTTAQDLYSVGVLLGWEKKQRITDVTD